MRKSSQLNKKKLTPLLVCSVLVLQQSLVGNAAFASTITDASGNAIATDPIDSAAVGKDVFNVRPDAFNGKYGFKQFKDLNLSEGDVLNFIYEAMQLEVAADGTHQHKYWDIDTFVNLVQNGVSINGIVNTLANIGDSASNNGNLVFISPNGMIVGSSGVLNVGSLNVFTPSVTDFNNMRNGLPNAETTASFSDGTTTALATQVTNTFDPTSSALQSGNSTITINGRIVSRGDVGLYGSQVNIGNGGLLLAGIGNDSTYITTNGAADTLFNSIVNSDNMSSGNAFASTNGKIVIKSTAGTEIAENAKVRNYNVSANSSVEITNTGSNGIKIAGEVSNPNGTMTITNQAGSLKQTSTGLIKNKGTLNATNTASGAGVDISGTVQNDGNMSIVNESGNDGFFVGGTITNNNGEALIHNQVNELEIGTNATVTSNGTKMEISNCGVNGLKIAGNVYNNTGTGSILNSDLSTVGGLDIIGHVQNDGTSIEIINSGAGGMYIDGKVLNNNGTATLSNTVKGLNIDTDGVVENNGATLYISNSGVDSLDINGSVLNKKGATAIENTADSEGALTIGGLVQNDGNQVQIKNNGLNGLSIFGTVDNNNGSTTVFNKNGSLFIADGANAINDGDNLLLDNSGAGGFIIDGNVTNNGGETVITNSNVKLLINTNGVVTNNNGTVDIENSGIYGLGITGKVVNNNGTTNILNTADSTNGDIEISGTVLNTNNGSVNINNYGAKGLNILETGLIQNDGASIIATNDGAGGLNIKGTVKNNAGTAEFTNKAGSLNVASTGVVTNDGTSLLLQNSGDGGLVIDGSVTNNKNTTKIKNTNNNLVINSTGVVSNSGTQIDIENSGANGLNIAGKVLNNAGTANITNTAGGLTVADGGLVYNDGASLNMHNDNGAGIFEIAGAVTNNNGNATLTNDGSAFNVSGVVTNNGTKLVMTNNLDDDLTISGKVLNNNGATEIVNTAEVLNITETGLVQNDGASLDITNNGEGGLVIDGKVLNNQNTTTITNNTNKLTISKTGVVENSGTKVEIKNNGVNGLLIAGQVLNKAGSTVITNGAGSTTGGLNISGLVENTGNSLFIENAGAGGINITGENGAKGTIRNTNGTLDILNTNGGIQVTNLGQIYSSGDIVTVKNTGVDGINIEGTVTHENTAGRVEFINENSDMTIGHTSNDFNIDSNADVNITVKDGNLLNNGVAHTLIRTTEGADLIATVTNGSVGEEVGPCDGGICTGIGPSERDLTKSINTSIDGNITVDNTGNDALVNLASLDKDMNVNRIHSDGRVILLADDKTNKGATAYSILNKSADNNATPNLKGTGISAIASGNIGASKNDKVTFIQTGVEVEIANEHDDASQPHDLLDVPNVTNNGGVEFLAIGDINVKGLDNADGTKNDTNVCTISSREGSVNAEFSGDTYIRDITAQNEVNVVTRGTEMYIQNLGGAPSRYAETGDYYGNYDGIMPEKATLKALDMGTEYAPNEEPNSTIVVKNGTLNGAGSISHPNLDQDVTVTADNAYIGGYYFNMGKHRMPGLSEVTPDDRTNPLVNGGDPEVAVSIRGRAVRPDDVTATGEPEGVREYYYGYDPDNGETPDDAGPDGPVSGSGQRDDEGFDPDKEDGDDLVVPVPEEETPPPAGDDDDDQPDPPPPAGDDDDDQPDPPPPAGDDDDDQPDPPPPAGDDDDDQPDPPPPAGDDDDDQPDPPPPAGDDDDDQPDPPPPAGDDDDDQPDPPPVTPDPPKPPVIEDEGDDEPDVDAIKQTWKKEYTDYIEVIDKRQYMRFDTEYNQNPVAFNSDSSASGILNISRGGVQLSHNKSLKVGDVVPVHIKYGDVEINTDVKVVSATDRTAGAEFVDLDLATKNKILYLSLLDEQGERPEGEFYADIKMKNDSLSTTGVDD